MAMRELTELHDVEHAERSGAFAAPLGLGARPEGLAEAILQLRALARTQRAPSSRRPPRRARPGRTWAPTARQGADGQSPVDISTRSKPVIQTLRTRWEG